MNNVYDACRDFLKKYPMTVAWRVKQHAKLIQEHINEDEVPLYAFLGQKDTTILQPMFTTAIVFTNKRMLMASKKFFGRYYYTSITPDMLNDFQIRASFIYGEVEIDTVKEHFKISCLDKKSLPKIEDALSKYLLNEKLKLMKNKKDSK